MKEDPRVKEIIVRYGVFIPEDIQLAKLAEECAEFANAYLHLHVAIKQSKKFPSAILDKKIEHWRNEVLGEIADLELVVSQSLYTRKKELAPHREAKIKRALARLNGEQEFI